MIRYTLTSQEFYRASEEIMEIGGRRKVILITSISSTTVGLSVLAWLLLNQYLFAIFAILLGSLLLSLITVRPKVEARKRVLANELLGEEYELDFTATKITMKVGDNLLGLNPIHLSEVRKTQEMYSLVHKTGVRLIVPRRVLDSRIEQIIDGYSAPGAGSNLSRVSRT